MDTLSLMLFLPAFSGDAGDTQTARRELYRPVAEAIDRATSNPLERAALVADGYFESRFARYVLERRCSDGPRGMRCDPDKHGVPRARGPWQVWHYCHRDGLAGEAECVLDQMRLGRVRCASWEGAFSALKGGSCSWPGAVPRVQLLRRLIEK